MKIKAIYILASLMLIMTACSDSSKEPVQPTEYKLELETRKLSFPTEDNSPRYITVTALNVDWDISIDEIHNWLHAEKEDGKIKVYCDPSPQPGERTATFTVTSDVQSVEAVVVTVVQDGLSSAYDLVFTSAEAIYYEKFDDGTGNTFFVMNLMSEGIYVEDNFLMGSGRVVYLEFFSEVPQSKIEPDIASGTYRFNNSHDKFSALPGLYDDYWGMYSYSTVKTLVDGSSVSIAGISGGSMEVVNNDGYYRIILDITMDNGTKLTGIYTGEMICYNNYMSDLTGDTVISDLVAGDVTFYGDYYENDTYNWIVYLWSGGISIDENEGYLKGSGNVVWMDITSNPAGGKLFIPSGKYHINESLQPNTALTGMLDYFSGYMVGCWYAEYMDGRIVKKAPMSTGAIDITQTEGRYTFAISVRDDIGFSIDAGYTGSLDYIDDSEFYYNLSLSRNSSGRNRFSSLPKQRPFR